MSSAGDRLADAVSAVVRAALEARAAARVALLDDGSPEAALAAGWLQAGLGPERVVRVSASTPGVESLLHAAAAVGGGVPAAELEALRLAARLLPGAATAHPANKTALLLGGPLPPEPLLPLGDVWASEVRELCGAWSAPHAVGELASAAGGIEALDGALRGWLEGRDPRALDRLPAGVAGEVRARFAAGRADRIHPRVVPKLTARTLGVDLFE